MSTPASAGFRTYTGKTIGPAQGIVPIWLVDPLAANRPLAAIGFTRSNPAENDGVLPGCWSRSRSSRCSSWCGGCQIDRSGAARSRRHHHRRRRRTVPGHVAADPRSLMHVHADASGVSGAAFGGIADQSKDSDQPLISQKVPARTGPPAFALRNPARGAKLNAASRSAPPSVSCRRCGAERTEHI